MGSTANTLYPEEKLADILLAHGQFKYLEYFPGSHLSDHYMQYFGKSSFRKMVRLLLQNGRTFVDIENLRNASGNSTEEYLQFLERLLVLERQDSSVRLDREIENLGPSLEHYVAELCRRELRGSAGWGVLLENLPRSGGDYDVLTWLDPSLMYVECKTSRPRNIADNELREFLQRSVELAPDLAVLLIDTDEPVDTLVEDRINSILSEEVDVRAIANRPLGPHPDYPGIFFGFSRVYVTNSKKTILRQIQKCLQHYYAHVKGLALWSAPYLSEQSINFIHAPLRPESE